MKFSEELFGPKELSMLQGEETILGHWYIIHFEMAGKKILFVIRFRQCRSNFYAWVLFDKTLQSWRGKKIEADLMSKMAAAGGRSSPDVFWAEPKLFESWAWLEPIKPVTNDKLSCLGNFCHGLHLSSPYWRFCARLYVFKKCLGLWARQKALLDFKK